MAQNIQTGITRQRPQQNVFLTYATTSNANTSIDLPITATFPVKEIHFTVAYDIYQLVDDLWYITCDMPIPDMSIVATCNRLVYTNVTADEFRYVDSLDDSKKISYILREPTVLTGTHKIYLRNFNGTSTVAPRILLRVELLG